MATKKPKTEDLLTKMEEQVEEIAEVPAITGANLPTTQVSSPRGFEEEEDPDDLIMPRARLLQSMSPECQAENGDGMPGEIRHSIMGTELPQLFTPIFYFKDYAKFNARNKSDKNYDPAYELGALIWKTNDHKDSRVLAECKFKEDNTPPTAIIFFNFFSLFEGQDMPTVISFSKTSYKTGRDLFNMAKFTGKDMFAMQYKLTSKLEQNDSGSYYVLKVALAGKTTDETYAKCEGLWQTFHKKREDIIIDVDGE